AGDSQAAKTHALQAADAVRGLNPNLFLVGLHRAAEFALTLGQLTEAQAHVGEALAVTRQAGAGHSLTWVLVTAGTVSLAAGDELQAAAQYAEAVERAAELGLTGSAGTVRALDGIACCSVAAGQWLEQAARLLASTEAQCAKTGWAFTGAD